MNNVNKRLRRSTSERVLAGVCGGFAEYFELDPVLVRVAYVLLSLCTAFCGTFAYILLWIVMPKDDRIS